MRLLVLVLATAGCECRDYVPERGRECRHSGQELRLERTSPLAPPVAVCRCPCETVPEQPAPDPHSMGEILKRREAHRRERLLKEEP